MSRRSPGLAELFVLAPWWLSVVVGIAVYTYLRWIFLHFAVVAKNPITQAFASSARVLAPFVLVGFGLLAVLSAWFAHTRRKLVDQTSDIESLRAWDWKKFEWLVGEIYRRQGYAIDESISTGPDGGIDLVLRKEGRTTVVQCKQWRAFSVNVRVVRELLGVMTAEKADAAIVITSGKFTREAWRFAQENQITLIDGPQLLALVQAVQRSDA